MTKVAEKGNIHTTIPYKYADYARKHNLKWSQLLISAIEQEMNQDPEYINKKIQQNEVEREKLIKDFQNAKNRKITIDEKTRSMRQGLMPVE